jgi:predicted transcriptional regulator
LLSLFAKPITIPPTVVAQWLRRGCPHQLYFIVMSDSGASMSNNSEHKLFEPLVLTINIAMGKNHSPEKIADTILQMLDRHRLTVYARPNQVSLLNGHGRVLIAVLEDPGITQRALSQYLGVSESNINNSIKILMKNNLITKTKVKNKNTYSFNYKDGLKHPDISRFLDTLMPFIKKFMDEDGDSTNSE